jgi:hypothetical protein
MGRCVRSRRSTRCTTWGLSVQETRPFVECLAGGHLAGDECPESLAAYRHAIDQLPERITRLARRRDALATHLEMAANGAMPPSSATDLTQLPERLPVPRDDGAAAHRAGLRLPPSDAS